MLDLTKITPTRDQLTINDKEKHILLDEENKEARLTVIAILVTFFIVVGVAFI